MRKLTSNEKKQAPEWAEYYSISNRDSVYFVNSRKTQCYSLSSPKLGVIKLVKGTTVYNNLAKIK